MRRSFLVAALLLWSCRPGCAIQPISNVHVSVSSAGVTGLDCRRRAFQMEYAKGMGRRYRHVSRGTFTSNPDPRVFLMGLGAMLFMAPLAVLSVPADLLAAPLRRECDFELHVEGELVGWAGSAAGDAAVSLQGRSLVTPGLEDDSAPVYRSSQSSATADAQGRFSISLPGRVGRSRDFEIHWLVDTLSSGSMSLRKSGGKFVLSEPEPEFGSAGETIEPIVIRPKRRRP